LSFVLCILCCQFLWIVLFHYPFGIPQHLFVLSLTYPMLPVSLDFFFHYPFRFSLTFICPFSCASYVASSSGLSFFITPSVLSNIYLYCFLCTLCCQFLLIFILIGHSVFSNIYLSFVLCILCCQFFLDCPFSLPLRYSLTFICLVSCISYVASFSGFSFFIYPSIFSNIYMSFLLCILCCQFLWIVLFRYLFGIL
jgi:hypothetical protein